jgi:hypothetical protein
MVACETGEGESEREIGTRTEGHAHTHTCIHTYKHTYIHTCRQTDKHPYIHTCIQTDKHPYIHTCIQTDKHPSILTLDSNLPSGPALCPDRADLHALKRGAHDHAKTAVYNAKILQRSRKHAHSDLVVAKEAAGRQTQCAHARHARVTSGAYAEQCSVSFCFHPQASSAIMTRTSTAQIPRSGSGGRCLTSTGPAGCSESERRETKACIEGLPLTHTCTINKQTHTHTHTHTLIHTHTLSLSHSLTLTLTHTHTHTHTNERTHTCS